jgi:predicted dehydrogenase
MKNFENSRRSFIRKILASGAVAGATPLLLTANEGSATPAFNILNRQGGFAANDQINLALIGAGGMGSADANTALKIDGVRLVAVCDLYQGRLEKAKESWGAEIFTTRDYKEILSRDDIDAVIIGTPDHWHKQISVDALLSGKSVYCEKPMVHSVDEGHEVIKAQKKSGKVFQVGSQGLASLGNEKAKELLAAGAIGELNYAEGFWARNSPIGAWQYNVPEDASEETVDWDRYLSNTTKRDFDALRFFRWRNYRDYGTGMSGDLFVHLFSSLHFITGSMGPDKVYASGGLRYWKDGREVPDVLMGVFDYPQAPQHPGFNLSLRCNFVDGTSGSTYLKLVGSEGSMDVDWERVTVKRNSNPRNDDAFLQEKTKDGGPAYADRKRMLPPKEMVYQVEDGYEGAHYDHFAGFFNAIRNNRTVVEDAKFGYRAAAPALLCNDSYFNDTVLKWDPIEMKLVK